MFIINNINSSYSKLIKIFINQLPETLKENNDFIVVFKIKEFDVESSTVASYQREFIKDNELHISIKDIDISELIKYLSFDEMFNTGLQRFIDAIDVPSFYEKFSTSFDRFSYNEEIINIFKDNTIYLKTKEALLSNNHDYFVVVSKLISYSMNNKISTPKDIFDLRNFRDQKSSFERYRDFNDTFLDEIIKHSQTNKPDFLLNKDALNFFQFQQPYSGAAGMASKSQILLGLVVSSIYKISKKEQKYNRAFSNLSSNGPLKDTLDEITDDLITETEKVVNKESGQLTTVSDEIKFVKNQINQINIPKNLTSEVHFLNLDDHYKEHREKDYGHNVSRSQVLQNYRNNKKKQLQILNVNNQKRWISSISSKHVNLSEGIITLSYWRLFYYNHDLYKDLRNLHSEKSLNTIINTFLKYYSFIHFDLYDGIPKYFYHIIDDIDIDLEETYNKISEIETNNYLSKPATLDKLRTDYEDLRNIKDEFENITLDKLKELGKNLINLHFNAAIIEKILSEYIIAISNHELTLKSLFDEDKDITHLI